MLLRRVYMYCVAYTYVFVCSSMRHLFLSVLAWCGAINVSMHFSCHILLWCSLQNISCNLSWCDVIWIRYILYFMKASSNVHKHICIRYLWVIIWSSRIEASVGFPTHPRLGEEWLAGWDPNERRVTPLSWYKLVGRHLFEGDVKPYIPGLPADKKKRTL